MKRGGAAIRLTILVAVAAVSGCAWFGGDDDELGPAALMEFEPEAELERRWAGSVGRGLGDLFNAMPPAVVGDRIYAADAYGVVEARNRESGERLWRTRIGSPDRGFLEALPLFGRDDDGGSFVTGGVTADDFAVLVGTDEGELVALRADDGGELWRARLSSEILAPPAIDRERVYVATQDGRLTALSRSDGARLWSYDTQVPVLSIRGTSSPVVSEPLVFVGFANGRMAALEAERGQVIWEHAVALPAGRSELERMADVDATPLITPRGAFAASYQGTIKSLRLADGQVQWERPLSSVGALDEGYGQVYATDEEGVVHAFDQSGGAAAWRQEGLLRRGVTGPTVFGPYIAVGDAEGWVHLFAQSDGRPIARVRADGDGVRTPLLVVGDTLYVLGNGGRLVAYAVEREE